MNKKISKILGVGMTIVMLASLLVMATPTSASALGWGEESTSKDLKAFTGNKLAPALTDIVDLAVSGTTIYAAASGVTAATGNTTYKSTDGGATWSSLYYTTSYPTTKVVKKVAVAPDDVNTVVILTTDNTVYYSSNGGSSWSNLSVPASGATIHDIDVSGGTTKAIAAAGSVGGVAELYTLSVSLAQSWTPRYATTGSAPAGGARTNQTDIFAVKLSPNYSNDNIAVVVSGNTTDNITYAQTFRNTSGARGWNDHITGFTNWATGIQLETLSTGIAAADIALRPTYRGADETERIAFVATAGATSGGKVTRLSDVTATELKTWSGVSLGAVGSIALHASGKLLAGDYDTNQVYYFSDSMASSPKSGAITSLKQPGGVSKTVVAWVGDSAVAGTSGAESAFAVSTDSGKTFNDISLIDTTISTMSDFAINAAGSKIYLTTNDGTDTSVWVKTTAWQRILSRKADTTKHLVRIAPDNDAVAYVADQGTQDMWVTKDSGMTWTYIPIYNLTAIQDFVVQSADVVYAIDTTGLSKTSDAGGSWGSKKTPTDAFAAYMVTLATNSANTSDVFIGGSDGYVAFSKDSGATVTRTLITAAGNVQVVADKDYATNNVIYAGVNAAVYRGKADATSSFSARSPVFDAAYISPVITGLVRDGTIIYAVSSSNASTGALSQAQNLTPTVDSATNALWSTVVTNSYGFAATPKSLQLASGSTLWALGTTSKLVSYTTTLAATGPTLTAPANNAVVPVNVTTGRAYNVSFTFNRPAGDTSGVTNFFEIEIATDTAFGGKVLGTIFTDIDEATETRILGPGGTAGSYTFTGTGFMIEFMPNSTYYWRMRVAKGGATPQSAWSETRTLKIDKTAPAVAPIPFDIVSPVRGAANVPTNAILTWTPYEGAIGYEVALATDDTFKIIDFSHNVPVSNLFYASEPLNYSTTYYWRVRGVTGPAPAKAAAPGGPWATGAFTTAAEPAKAVVAPPTTPAAPQVIIQKEPPEIKVVEVPVSTPAPIPSYLLWIIIIIGAVLIIALITLIARTRRVT